jgi:hypothetical protein
MVLANVNWFDKFLTGLVLFLMLFMFAGMGASQTSTIRSLDASIGLLKRATPYSVKNIIKVASFQSINTYAFPVEITADPANQIFRAIDQAFMSALSSIVQSLVGSIFGLFDKLLSSIESWINSLAGLQDSVKSFMSAFALKIYSLQECLVQSSASLVSSIYGVQSSNTGATQTNCANGSSSASGLDTKNGDFSKAGESFTISDNVGSGTLQDLQNAIASNRVAGILNYANSSPIPGTQPNDAQAKDNGNNTQSVAGVPTKAQIETQQNEIAATIGTTKCGAGNIKKATQGIIIEFSDFNAYSPAVVECTAKAKQALASAQSSDIAAFKRGQENLIAAAPTDCKFTGFLSETPLSIDFANTNGANQFGNSNFTVGDAKTASFDKFTNGPSYSAGIGAYSASYDTKVLTSEQCKAADRMPGVLASAQTDKGSAGGNGFDLGSIVTSVVNALTKFITNFVTKVFNSLLNVVTKFISTVPGGNFLSSAFTDIFSSSNNALQGQLANIVNVQIK